MKQALSLAFDLRSDQGDVQSIDAEIRKGARLGGMAMFGLTGFVIGPAIAALFIASWDLFAPPHPPANPPGMKL